MLAHCLYLFAAPCMSLETQHSSNSSFPNHQDFFIESACRWMIWLIYAFWINVSKYEQDWEEEKMGEKSRCGMSDKDAVWEELTSSTFNFCRKPQWRLWRKRKKRWLRSSRTLCTNSSSTSVTMLWQRGGEIGETGPQNCKVLHICLVISFNGSQKYGLFLSWIMNRTNFSLFGDLSFWPSWKNMYK